MNDIDAARVVDLRAHVAASQMAVQLAREHLIDQLGDHMCGAPGGGPTRADLKALARARRIERQAQYDLAQFLAVSTLKTLGYRPLLLSPTTVPQRPNPDALG